MGIFQQSQDDDPMLATKRRHIWEMYADVRAINTILLIYAICCTVAMAGVVFVLLAIYTRPPYILSEDEGMVMWRTTEAFKLREDMVDQFLGVTLGTIYNVSPSDYDLTPIAPYILPDVFDKLTGKAGETAEMRVRTDQRQFFNILGIRRVTDTKYPNFIAMIVRADQTTMNETRDSAGNIITTSKSAIVFVIAYLDQRTPTPANPWGLYVVGIEKGTSANMERAWETAVALEGTRDGKGNTIQGSGAKK